MSLFQQGGFNFGVVLVWGCLAIWSHFEVVLVEVSLARWF